MFLINRPNIFSMLSIRSFRNTDPPKIVEIWRQFFLAEPQKVLPLSLSAFSENVLDQPFFDGRSFFLAFDDGFPVGFAHASLGPNRNKSDLSSETGVIHLMMTVPLYPDRAELSRRLLEHCENYLRSNGVKVIFGGAPRSCASFYTGLYGGSEPIGIYESDEALIAAYLDFGYHVRHNVFRYACDLSHFQVPFTPKSVGWRRKLTVNYTNEPPMENWFQTCTATHFHWFNAAATLGPCGEQRAQMQIRLAPPTVMPGTNVQTPPAAALTSFQVVDLFLRQGIGTFLFGGAVRRLASDFHPGRIETIVMREEDPFVKFLRKLGWKEGEKGKVFMKILQERRKAERMDD